MSINTDLDILDNILYDYYIENPNMFNIITESIFNEKKK